ncbi:alpha/beta hydrolase [Qipengyuania qiaonensis]|uniref:Xaa-Pro dipeptidyl-peptidase-like domain-containing protein n=1 Tax=Qipengyuania qiaonensis TaxID=2867240 RepID=A0ABS7J929_9SPHN|nr:CocE/NonD family hydrolase [Qipengyuania qiaonensis]MBX7482158.1 hypothetical protein [Qipengyuania qiaonensis]
MKLLAAAALATSALTGTAQAATKIPVTFESDGETIVGDLYLPDDYEEGDRLSAVVVTGAWMTVRQQMAGRYAAELADRGYAALAFDFRNWGESGGTRRQFEDPQSKIADIEAAAKFLASRPETDEERIGGLGICASAGYMVTASLTSSVIRSVSLVAPWLHDTSILADIYGGDDGMDALVRLGDEAGQAYAMTGQQTFVPAASMTDANAIMYQAPYYTEADRGMIADWRNEADPGFWRGWLTFNAIEAAPLLKQPFLMVHSESAAIPEGAHRFFDLVPAQKTELWLEAVTQFDFYDQQGPVTTAADAVARHFGETL